MKVFILVPVHNRLTITERFLKQVKNLDFATYSLVVIDDGSCDGTREMLYEAARRDSRITVIHGSGSDWWGGAINRGLGYVSKISSDRDLVILTNDDIEFDRDLVSRFVDASQRYPRTIIGSVSIHGGRVHSAGSKMVCWPLAITSHPFRGQSWPIEKTREPKEIDFQGGNAVLYPIEVLRDVGFVASSLNHYHGDGELSWRAVRKGYRSIVDPNIAVRLNIQTTGLFNDRTKVYTFKELLESMKNTKSVINIPARFNFALLSAPKIWVYPYFISHTVRSITVSLIKIVVNRFVAVSKT
jgi:GT2 family glycosyltransferase